MRARPTAAQSSFRTHRTPWKPDGKTHMFITLSEADITSKKLDIVFEENALTVDELSALTSLESEAQNQGVVLVHETVR